MTAITKLASGKATLSAPKQRTSSVPKPCWGYLTYSTNRAGLFAMRGTSFPVLNFLVEKHPKTLFGNNIPDDATRFPETRILSNGVRYGSFLVRILPGIVPVVPATVPSKRFIDRFLPAIVPVVPFTDRKVPATDQVHPFTDRVHLFSVPRKKFTDRRVPESVPPGGITDRCVPATDQVHPETDRVHPFCVPPKKFTDRSHPFTDRCVPESVPPVGINDRVVPEADWLLPLFHQVHITISPFFNLCFTIKI